MKNLTRIIFILLTTTFSAFAAEEEAGTDRNGQNGQNTIAVCSPQPDCNQDQIHASDAYEEWVDRLTMQQLMELLKIQQDPSTQAAETNDG